MGEQDVRRAQRGLRLATWGLWASGLCLAISALAVLMGLHASTAPVVPYLMWNHLLVLVVAGAGVFSVRRLHGAQPMFPASPRPRELFAPWVLALGALALFLAGPDWAGYVVAPTALPSLGHKVDGVTVTHLNMHTSADGTHFYIRINHEAEREISQADYQAYETAFYAVFARVWVGMSWVALVIWRYAALGGRAQLGRLRAGNGTAAPLVAQGHETLQPAPGGRWPHLSRLLVPGLWALVLLANLAGLVIAPERGQALCAQRMPDEFLFPVALLPLVVFGLGGFFGKRSPFIWPWLAELVDERWGRGCTERFLVRLKPLLLMAVAMLCSVLGMILGCPAAPSASGFALGPLFFTSGAAGFVLAHVVMRWRKVPGV